MDYSFQHNFTIMEKDSIANWVRQKLIEFTGECDEVFLEYVMVMIANGKTMAQISEDLIAFIGEQSSTDFGLSLGNYLMNMEEKLKSRDDNNLNNEEGASKSIVEPLVDQQKNTTKKVKSKIINLSGSHSAEDAKLKSDSRITNQRDNSAQRPTTSGTSRLLQSAIRSSIQKPVKETHQTEPRKNSEYDISSSRGNVEEYTSNNNLKVVQRHSTAKRGQLNDDSSVSQKKRLRSLDNKVVGPAEAVEASELRNVERRSMEINNDQMLSFNSYETTETVEINEQTKSTTVPPAQAPSTSFNSHRGKTVSMESVLHVPRSVPSTNNNNIKVNDSLKSTRFPQSQILNQIQGQLQGGQSTKNSHHHRQVVLQQQQQQEQQQQQPILLPSQLEVPTLPDDERHQPGTTTTDPWNMPNMMNNQNIENQMLAYAQMSGYPTVEAFMVGYQQNMMVLMQSIMNGNNNTGMMMDISNSNGGNGVGESTNNGSGDALHSYPVSTYQGSADSSGRFSRGSRGRGRNREELGRGRGRGRGPMIPPSSTTSALTSVPVPLPLGPSIASTTTTIAAAAAATPITEGKVEVGETVLEVSTEATMGDLVGNNASAFAYSSSGNSIHATRGRGGGGGGRGFSIGGGRYSSSRGRMGMMIAPNPASSLGGGGRGGGRGGYLGHGGRAPGNNGTIYPGRGGRGRGRAAGVPTTTNMKWIRPPEITTALVTGR